MFLKQIISFLAKFIGSSHELTRHWPWVVSKHYGLCVAKAFLEPGQTPGADYFAKIVND